MESIALRLLETLGRTLLDVLPILLVVFLFQALVIRRSIPNLKRLVASVALVVAGLVFFLEGLELALFPLGALMAEQLTNPVLSRHRGRRSWTRPCAGRTTGRCSVSPPPWGFPPRSPSRR